MYVMYDSVDVDQIPENPHAVAAYVNGSYANVDKVKERFPDARILTISVTNYAVADCFDIESDDYKPSDAAELYQDAVRAGVWRPCFYADLSNMPAVKKSLNTVVKDRKDIRLWVALYDNSAYLPEGYDAKQFTDKALERNLDESICDSTFFKAAPKKVTQPVLVSTPKIHATVEYDPTTDEWVITKL